MKGNFHVRFLGECGRGNPPALTRSVNELKFLLREPGMFGVAGRVTEPQ
jgi:hypothetical protein